MKSSFHSPFVLPVNLDINKTSHRSKSQPLKGWTLAVKDLFDIDGIVTTAGNPDWAATHPVPTQTSETVACLLEAGAEFVGKTITDELAYSLNGQNIHYPELVNCLDEERISGGSSSGSVVAVGRNLARIGLGTDTGGSIRVPASYNNLVGFRPTHGVISLKGVVPLAPSFDTAGFITNTIQDALAIAKCLIPDQQENSKSLNTPVVLSELVGLSQQRQEIFNWLESKFNGCWVKDKEISAETVEQASNAFRVLQGREIWQTHGDWIINSRPKFAEDIQQRFEWCETLTKEDELSAIQQQQKLQTDISSLLKQDRYLILPTTPGPAPRLDTSASEIAEYRKKLMQFTCIAGLTGCPQLHMPLFKNDNTAYGLSILGPKNSDLALLSLGQKLMETAE
ncbi:amidase [Aliiglaciecola lipolytica]|uniref:amidase n=1 Tax=Aliiglaciecola lipolytica TaxID=477689 RepID=UPI001C0A3D38|nr:amidase [Aliiglaciecola lipolytica]MBU2876366.1 amidase [Aliiglaciecola lipolytica]